MSSLSRQTVEALNIPPDEYEQLIDPEVLAWVEGVKSGTIVVDNTWLYERAKAISESFSDENLASLPTDGSINHDHHLYGAPKQVETK